ncbi:MAG: winged helix DNA-binding domain-containing protein [Actinomycetota bacterium]
MREPVDVARAIAGAQAQDTYAGPLTFRSRSRRLTAADIDRARTRERSLLRTWVMRMTIHLIPTDDAGWLLPLFEPAIEKWSRRRLEQFGMSARTQDKALRVVKRALEKEGPLTRPEMAERISSAGVELDSSTRLHIILVAVTSGIACLGPNRGSSTCLVLRDDWLGQLPPFDRDAALAELARRYLRAFGPATERDFAYWSGLGLREVRTGLAGIASELTESRLGDHTALSLKGKRSRLPPTGQVRMLGAFDTYMLGYRSRDFAVPPEHVAAVKEGGGGWIRPVIVRDGVVIGGWRSTRSGGRIEISLNLLQPLSAAVRKAIDAEVADIARFEGIPVEMAGDAAG